MTERLDEDFGKPELLVEFLDGLEDDECRVVQRIFDAILEDLEARGKIPEVRGRFTVSEQLSNAARNTLGDMRKRMDFWDTFEPLEEF